MEINTVHTDDLVELLVQGILDTNWADHLQVAIDEVIRGQSHRLLVNLKEVTYLSSAGISVLLKAHAQFQRIHGFFGVCDPSPHVRQVLRLTGLEKRLICDGETARRSSGSMLLTSRPEFQLVSQGEVDIELYELDAKTPLRCRLFGDAGRLADHSFHAESNRRVSYVPETFGLGVGAFGDGFAACRERFGEFLAAGGAAVQLPPQSGSAPDYQLAREEFVPVVEVLYGLQCFGDFSCLARFEPSRDTPSIGLAALAEQCLALSNSSLAAMVIVAESAGLVGAALRRSPASNAAAPLAGDSPVANGTQIASDLFSHPGVREWLSFSPERLYPRSLALVVGVAGRSPLSSEFAGLAPMLRPLNDTGDLVGHFHAVPFPYAPLKKRRLNLQQTVEMLFEAKVPQGVLHLLADYRKISGAGESQFVSGASWIAPITEVLVEGS